MKKIILILAILAFSSGQILSMKRINTRSSLVSNFLKNSDHRFSNNNAINNTRYFANTAIVPFDKDKVTAISKFATKTNSIIIKDSDIESKANVSYLVTATDWQDEPLVKKLLKSGSDTESRDIDRSTPLIKAAGQNNFRLVKLLLKNGANINATNDLGFTPLLSAASAFNCSEELVIFLIQSGANTHIVDKFKRNVLSQIVSKGFEKATKLLVDRGADANWADDKGYTPLMNAAMFGKPKIIQMLIDADADIDAVDCAGETALFKAAYRNHNEVVSLLISEGASVKEVINYRDSKGNNLLMEKCRWGDREDVKTLIDLGIDVNATNNNGETAIMHAIDNQNFTIGIVSLLIAKGADVSKVNNQGISVLDLAFNQLFLKYVNEPAMGYDNDPKVVFDIILKALNKAEQNNALSDKLKAKLASYCSIGAINEFYSAEEVKEWNQKSIDNLLKEKHRDLNKQDQKLQTPLLWCIVNNNTYLAEQLIQAGCDINQFDEHGQTPLLIAVKLCRKPMLKLLIEYGALVDDLYSDKNLPLMWAARYGFCIIADILIKHKANVNRATNNGYTPLMIATASGRPDVSTVMLLVDSGANIDAVNKFGQTALLLAVISGNEKMVETLLYLGADVNKPDKNGNTLLMAALSCGHTDIAQLLVKRGADISAINCDGYTAMDIDQAKGHVL